MEKTTHFDSALYESAYPTGIEKNHWHIARGHIVHSLLPRSNAGVLLEIGCGPGIVVDFLRQQGRDCWGCDLGAPEPVSEALRAFLLLGQDAFDLDPAFRDRITILLLLDVLEHLSDPAAFLAQCRAHFTNVQHVIITLPARQELWSVYDEFFGHYLRYDLSGVRTLLAQGGLKESELRYFFHTLYLPMRMMALLKMQRRTVNRAPRSALAKLAHRLLGAAFYLEPKLVPHWLPGSSISAVAEFER